MLIHGLQECPPLPERVSHFHLLAGASAWWCPCGWELLAGIRDDQEGTVIGLVAFHQGAFAGGKAYRIKDDAPVGIVQEMIADVGKKPCPGLYGASRMN